MYEYEAIVTSVYDADTIRVDIDLGFFTWIHNQSIRLKGIDAPEIRGAERPQGLVAKDALLTMIQPGDQIVLRTYKDSLKGKYGRWVADVFTNDGVHVNEWLVANDYATKVDY